MTLSHRTLLLALIAFASVAGCGFSTNTVKYSKGEVELIPDPLLPRVLKAPASDVTVEVTASQLHGYATVIEIISPNSVVVSDGGEQSTLSFDNISTIRQRQQPHRSDHGNTLTGTASAGEVIGTTLIYAPLIPIAAITWPFMRMAGLDSNKNFADEAKAMAIFGGLSRQAIHDHLGTPQSRHHCRSRSGNHELTFEVWSYPKERVLRGARALFFDLQSDEVYSASVSFPTWADCAPLTDGK